MSVKLEGFVKPFKGKGDTWDLFWSKFSGLADESGWDTEDKYMSRLPLFLEGDAFLVFTRMSDADKKKKDKVQEVMVKSFSVVKDKAYGQFTTRKLKPDESPDAFVAELRRLLEASGHKVRDDKDSVLISQVLAGLPSDVCKQVRLAFAGKDMTISGCLEAVRALLSVNGAPLGMAGPSSTGSVAASNVVCHRCGETGHFRKACPKRSSSSSRSGTNGGGNRSGAQRGATGSTCFFCDKSGHMKKDCPARKQWLAQQDRMLAAAAQDQSATPKKCLCTVSANAELPRMYVEVAGKESSQDPCRVEALVDTGSTQTLVAESVASCLNLEVMPTAPGDGGIVALDGKPLNVLGTVERANHTILSLIHKVLDHSADWVADLRMLEFYHRTRPHSVIRISPMKAMVGWECPHFIIENEISACAMSVWASKLSEQSARIRDLLEEELSSGDFIEVSAACPYEVGDHVLLQIPSRHQKRLPPFEDGWVVKKVVSPSTIVVMKPGRADKVANIAILKRNPAPPSEPAPPLDSNQVPDVQDDECCLQFEMEGDSGDNRWSDVLRDRRNLQVPVRYRE